MSGRHEDNFRTLDIEPTESTHKIRRAYQLQIRRWHPDRFPAGSAAQRTAEEKTKRINRAYDALTKEPLRIDIRLSPPSAADNNEPDAAALKPVPVVSRRAYRFAGVCGLLAVGYLLWFEPTPIDDIAPPEVVANVQNSDNAVNAARSPAMQNDPYSAPIAANNKILIGSSTSDVLRLLGPPLAANPRVWEYGPSRIYFTNGTVSGWYESPYRSLPVR